MTADRSRISIRVAAGLATVGLSLGLVARFFARPHAPFWLDETLSGAIASAPDLSSYFRLIRGDVNGPLYYLLLGPWRFLFGSSDAGLRSLSLVFSALAPIAVAVTPVRGLKPVERMAWAAILALWIPGIGYAQSAKPLAVALCFSTLQLLAYINLMQQAAPKTRSATLWVGLSSLAIGAHYDVAYIALAQGLIYLAVRRSLAVKTWPAVLILTPIAVEIGLKADLLAHFTAKTTTWYHLFSWSELPIAAAYVLGGLPWLLAYPVLFVAFGFVGRNTSSAEAGDDHGALFWTSLATVLAVAAILVVGAIRPTFSVRYLGPFAPGVLLAALLAVRRIAGSEKWIAYSALVGTAAAFATVWWVEGATHPDSNFDDLSIEQASEALMRSGVHDVVFTLDNPMAHGMSAEEGKAIGGFFFRRANVPASMTYVDVGSAQDPNLGLLQAAQPKQAAILWLFDTTVAGTAAIRHPPQISARDGRYQCRFFGRRFPGAKDTSEQIGAVACVVAPHGGEIKDASR